MLNLVAMTDEEIVFGHEILWVKLLSIPLLFAGLFPAFQEFYYLIATFPLILVALLILGYQMETIIHLRQRTIASALSFFQIPFPFSLPFVRPATPIDEGGTFLWTQEKYYTYGRHYYITETKGLPGFGFRSIGLRPRGRCCCS